MRVTADTDRLQGQNQEWQDTAYTEDLVSLRVLLVEDENAIRNLLDRALRDAGYDVLLASDGVTGFRIATEAAVDLVVTNNRLPGMSGANLIAALRRQRPNLPILHIDDQSHRPGGTELIPPDVVTLRKPFSVEAFQSTVKELLARWGGEAPPT